MRKDSTQGPLTLQQGSPCCGEGETHVDGLASSMDKEQVLYSPVELSISETQPDDVPC
ncbi:MAG: hypothetical protein ACOCZ2_04120 [Thermodesulfobacteriota bacterium]